MKNKRTCCENEDRYVVLLLGFVDPLAFLVLIIFLGELMLLSMGNWAHGRSSCVKGNKKREMGRENWTQLCTQTFTVRRAHQEWKQSRIMDFAHHTAWPTSCLLKWPTHSVMMLSNTRTQHIHVTWWREISDQPALLLSVEFIPKWKNEIP